MGHLVPEGIYFLTFQKYLMFVKNCIAFGRIHKLCPCPHFFFSAPHKPNTCWVDWWCVWAWELVCLVVMKWQLARSVHPPLAQCQLGWTIAHGEPEQNEAAIKMETNSFSHPLSAQQPRACRYQTVPRRVTQVKNQYVYRSDSKDKQHRV